LLYAAALPAVAQSFHITVIDVDQAAATLSVVPTGKNLLWTLRISRTAHPLKAALSRAGVTQIDELVIRGGYK
jgi:beta-lactamase superfamily II metal-dependent hydrolase